MSRVKQTSVKESRASLSSMKRKQRSTTNADQTGVVTGDCESEDDPSSVDSVVKCSRCAFRVATVFTDEHGKTGEGVHLCSSCAELMYARAWRSDVWIRQMK